MDALLMQHLLNWLVLGSIYTLIALGFSLLFGVLNVIHFSHGDVAMVGPFIALAIVQAVTAMAMPLGASAALLVAILAAMAAIGLLGVLLDWLVIRRFRTSPAMMALVATVALGTVIREMIRTLYPQGSNPKPFPAIATGVIQIGDVVIPVFSLIVIGVSVAMVAALFALISHTPVGVRIRAVAEDLSIARLMAVRPDRIFAVTFFIASAVGAIGAVFFVSHAGVVRFDFGIQLGLIGFSAAVIGGLGSMNGAILGSLLIAGVDVLVQVLVPDGASYRLVFIFMLTILVLVFKPSGMLGKPVFEKV
ncbi:MULTISPECIES: branched-chain amino acid ABC transporter permease [Aquamicrobium]|uniref:Branched-subunit amino acid ABC-type transport system permease component n=1 Tax=Aquamicrobium lusatiense TaxID=89772 RepID=A0A7W9VV75_9HYPH|nr:MULTISPECIES: branched-chain amino acid ABC transporter permease [Aquamicrobium]MBB6013549.1 branched-subunit amino acid ABC-type transport system permease component [Aquamicrobium lusatiense]MCK9549705.1 branched-chain amino acid ABC transporter permease [Aquamicrobium sp.]